jgi:hypothetical protein
MRGGEREKGRKGEWEKGEMCRKETSRETKGPKDKQTTKKV